ncbi:PucR-like helix-turn-helix protein [Rhodoglobus vestalii]|uniref:PucR-like helix-turn-helix protein n=1 Tax=Rhodoglobus vestalii TaxID=193384 RepID=A0A8H2K525_9MICO|nr:helix-turn-helix domain-containing protein [Rhodoglobus vestalii]TQO19948.1 PucR-like helix-turn-helix protein [Rhodoglobus vestalii]
MTYQKPQLGADKKSVDARPSGGSSLPTLAAVMQSIGTEIASLVETPSGDQHHVSGSVIYDSSGPAVRFPGAVALAVGMPLSGSNLIEQFESLTECGYVAVVYKSHGAPDREFRDAARRNGIALFRASDSVPWDQLAEFFHAAITPQGQSHQSLVDIRPGDLFELANTVASLIGGAIAIADPDQTVLAYSTLPEQPIDETRRTSILQLHVPHSPQNDQDYRRVHAAHDVVTVAPNKNSLTRSAVAIRAGSIVLGSLWLIDVEAPQSDDTDRVLLEAANIAALHLLHRRNNHDGGRTRQIELVKPLLFEPDRAELAAVQLGISADSVRVVAVAASGTAENAPESLQSSLLLFDTVRAACAVWLPTAVCGISDNIIYIVLPNSETSSQSFQREAVLRIAHHARRLISRPVLAGFGSITPIVSTAKSRLDSESVLAMLLRDMEEGRVRDDSDEIVADQEALGPRLQLRQLVTALQATNHLPGDFATRIAEHDARRKTSFELTVRTYLDCNSNAIETAAKLGLHGNTVRYRLSRIEPLFGVRLEDPETRLLVWLQLSARQL